VSDIFDQSIKDLMKLVTTDFDKFYEETGKENKANGYYSTAASSGYCSKAASSGYYSKAASSGDYSTAASSGDCSTAASSGYCSKAASSGYYSKAASSGDYSTAASSGYCSKAASSGDYSKAASSGDYSTAASSGDYSTAASSGDYSKAASSGYSSTAASSGKNSACSALGYRSAVKGDLGNLLMCSEYDKNGKPLGGKADLVDGKKLKANHWYAVKNGNWIEVDFTDGMFFYVISTKGSVKKLKNDDGEISYLVSEGDKHAHGNTIKEARDSLVYKIGQRDKSAYKDVKLSDKFTVPEFIEMYRVITGACEFGVKSFVNSQKKVKKQYSVSEIIKLTNGQHGSKQFKEFFK
jgi:hypothetical protein